MTDTALEKVQVARDRWWLGALAALFFGSGCAALIYEIVWFQLLELVIGSTAVSVGVLLATFMGGMCAGSLLMPRLIESRWNPLRVYAALEGCVGIFGIAARIGIPYLNEAYIAHVAAGYTGIGARAALVAACLLPPTFLMGAALPIVSRGLGKSRRDVSWLGILYCFNTAGGVFGAGLAGFYLLRLHDLAVANTVAVAINALVALAALGVSFFASYSRNDPERRATTPGGARSSRVYWITALAGMSALGAEIVWTRLLSLALGPTVYTFSVILVVFLTGLGIGSAVGAARLRESDLPMRSLGICQWLLAPAIVWAAYANVEWIPFWPIDPAWTPWQRILQFDLYRCAVAIGPATLLWGASFPLALGAAMEEGGDSGRIMGSLYAANTLGAIAGAIGFSLLLVPLIGTRQSQMVMVLVCTLAAAVALLRRSAPGGETGKLLAGLLVAGFLSFLIPAAPWQLVANGWHAAYTRAGDRPLFVGEGINSSIAVTTNDAGDIKFHVAGKVEASSGLNDMRLQRLLGLLPGLTRADSRSVLIVGCGAGVTAGTFVVQPSMRRIVICEMEPLVPTVATEYFCRQNFDVLNDPRLQIIYDDARHFVRTTNERFDVITSDPINPWVRGAATLYTREYFEMCRRHLNPGGAITQWVPLYETTPQAVKSELATFFDVFPYATIWINNGSDLVMFSQANVGAAIDLDAIQTHLSEAGQSGMAAAMRELGWPSAVDVFAHYAGRAEDLRPWLADAQINTDDNLRLGFLAASGRDLGDPARAKIYGDILRWYRYPGELFNVSPAIRPEFDAAMLREIGKDKP